MAPRVTDAERLAVHVETSYDGVGIRAAREDNSALGREAQAAAQQLTGALNQSAGAERGLAAAAREAASGLDTVRISHEKALEIERQAGGNAQRFTQLLREYRQEQLAVAAAIRETTAAQQQSQARGVMGGLGAAGDVATRSTTAGSVQRVNAELDKIPNKARTGANALSILAFSLQQGTGSAAGFAQAAGSAAFGLSGLTSSARLAASAAGVGALVTVLATAVILLKDASKEAKATDLTIQRIGRTSLTQIAEAEAMQRERVARAERQYLESVERKGLRGSVGPWSEQGRNRTAMQREQSALNEMVNRRVELTTRHNRELQEAQRLNVNEIRDTRSLLDLEVLRTAQLVQRSGLYGQDLGNLERYRQAAATEADIRRRTLELESEGRERAIRERFRQIDDAGKVIALTDEQRLAMETLLRLNRQITKEREQQLLQENALAAAGRREAIRLERARFDSDVREAYDARRAQIELERDAEIQATGDVAAAKERAELRLRQLRREVYRSAIDDLGRLAGATSDSNNKRTRAVEETAKALRRVMIGAEAALASVEAARAWGKSFSRAAAGDLRGAALEAAAAVQLTAAAALGFRESFGGGGSGGGSGGGGPALSSRDPRESPTNVTVVIQTVNPFSKEVLGETVFQLNRAGTLKTPIYAPATVT